MRNLDSTEVKMISAGCMGSLVGLSPRERFGIYTIAALATTTVGFFVGMVSGAAMCKVNDNLDDHTCLDVKKAVYIGVGAGLAGAGTLFVGMARRIIAADPRPAHTVVVSVQ